MPRFISLHSLACLTRQGAEELAARLHQAKPVRACRVLVNLYEGKMLVEFEAPNRESLQEWLADNGFHFDWLLKVEFESRDGELRLV